MFSNLNVSDNIKEFYFRRSLKTMKPLFYSVFSFFLGIQLACHPKSNLDVNVSNIPLHISIARFDHDLNQLDSSQGDLGYSNLYRKYPDFFPLFINKLASLGNYPTDYKQDLTHFLQNKDLRKLKKDCDSVYPNLNAFQAELEDGFRHFLYYFPHHHLPVVVAFYSGFNSAIVNTDSTLGIGLDMFLGSHYPIYYSIQLPRYLTRTLRSEYIPLSALKGYAEQIFPETTREPRMIDEMVYQGKILYFLDAMFPQIPDSMKITYSQDQLNWCTHHESEIWSSLLEDDRLFKGNKEDLSTYFGAGPFTPGLAPESAPRLGEWVGWQIIRKYMQANPSIQLSTLMADNDAEKILKGSGYRP